MKKKSSIKKQLNVFTISTSVMIIGLGCLMAIYIFFSIYKQSVIDSTKTAVYGLKSNVLEEGKEQISSFSENLIVLSETTLLEDVSKRQTIWDNYINSVGSHNIELVQIWNDNTMVFEKNTCLDNNIVNFIAPDGDNGVIMLKGSNDAGIYLICSTLIKDENGDTIGKIKIAQQLSDQSFINDTKRITGSEATIFIGNKRFLTTIKKDGVYQTGTTMDPKVEEAVLNKGNEYIGKVNILGEPYIVSYAPIFDMNNQPIGAFFVGKSVASAYKFQLHITVYMLILGGLLLFLFYYIARRWLIEHIINPIQRVSESIKKIAEEDYEHLHDMPKTKSIELETLQTSIQIMGDSIVNQKKKLETIAYIDVLTSLPNRASLYGKYKDISLVENEHSLSVMFDIDVDNLKYINHLFGQVVGDRLLCQVSDILKMIIYLYPEYQIYRIAGDEFVVCKEGDYTLDEIRTMAQNILSLFEKSFSVDQYNISMTVSVGVAYTSSCSGKNCIICTGECKDRLETLLKKAEDAMNRVKTNGKNNFIIFDPSMNALIERKALLQQELKEALKNENLMVYYQPKYNIKTSSYDGFEALIRWKHPQKGFISPVDFIPVAEETNLINEIGAWVLEKSCVFIKEFNIKFGKEFNVAVNVSAVQLLSDGFEEYVCKVLEKYKLEPQYLELEITESVFVNSIDIAYEKLKILRSMNISIALDDFGTGYSSFTYLKALPITTLKLDKTFIDDIVSDEVALKIAESVIQIGKSCGLEVVVEGVETVEQFQLLSKLECDYIQGYYFSKPVSEQAIYSIFEEEK
ncbi:EAL domain-containing protein [[Clostridium] fimetarium]|uniref:Diguanylate cyclase (GGDEF) domain-containing protein n=1 Tax=[Clostridium] fimetarium TaxID=99656 RepID=A0A1I0PUL6_9FIRM|nr:EAL domain-containing protein [[Clostridium] fimetarium]SEW18152.1 diguanylate cyclase (GGDEF) domain-containing protein [[Clostridium] fimetarium]